MTRGADAHRVRLENKQQITKTRNLVYAPVVYTETIKASTGHTVHVSEEFTGTCFVSCADERQRDAVAAQLGALLLLPVVYF